eukprot:CAMPEP_0184478550 /NCGR_PEP_ID=MMETSP0113_2-20130426/546_1 /TAXON_ID=91329 /ORGANISM="Norrisiella sphaerica, Strain BC52" /LENGTH=297 /DNA_ID=CAMNT_0026856385 /DNA_START=252 /DNA_END=1145 /DNA_ORIENTATION=-
MALFLVWWNQEFLLYQPTFTSSHEEGRQTPFNPKGFRTPAERHLPFEDVYLTTDDGITINGWLITAKESNKKPCILYLHGNAGNIGHRLLGLLELYHRVGCSIFVIDYRGYGNSSGSPSEAGLILDAKAALDYLSERAPVDNKKIVVFGRSLGGAVAIALTAKYQEKIHGLIIENTFTRIDDMATVLFSRIAKIKKEKADILLPFLYIYLTNPWRNVDRIGCIRTPLLFYSGLKDQLIPPEQMKQLFAAARSEIKMLHEVPEGDHNNTVDKGGDEYYDKFREFLGCIFRESKVQSTS